ncbi:uncharacterized protein [Physcomitrium patens]|uniref:Uncharacterized protein n=2 Tax=Physcomitrium patens TaxID=3218 RepID=A0A7I4EGU0_PHYPA|nr:uncharacterized protein LOC112285510 isoform X1 [Physcomitrium patens]|eukprot:XP_024382179.1 uncharacterized protein LOC112285510 isoform X1 [Physcomitrella patens]
MATSGSSRFSSQKKPPAGARGDTRVEKCEVFYTSLSDKLDALEQKVEPQWLTLEWVSLGIEFMRSTFSEIMVLFEDVRALMPDVKVAEEMWIEEYMIESMKLLDVCNVLKPAVSRFEHFMMCVQLVEQALERSRAGNQDCASNSTLMAALQTYESKLSEMIHPLSTVELSQTLGLQFNPKGTTGSPQRYASIAIGEKFTIDSSNVVAQPWPCPSRPNHDNSGIYKTSRSTARLAQVARATGKTTDFVSSVLIWALQRDPSAYPSSTTWQQNLETFRGDDTLWSPSFRRLQERLKRELFEVLSDDRCVRRQFAFEEVKLVQDCTMGIVAEIKEPTSRKQTGEESSIESLDKLEKQLVALVEKIQVRLERVSTQLNQLFDELVQARKKLLDATQRPGMIHRAHTF